MLDGSISYPVIQLRNGSAVLVYYRTEYTGRRSINLLRSANMKEQQKGTYSGRMTLGARKRMTKSIYAMATATKSRWLQNPITGRMYLHKFSFVTLTVSDPTTPLDGKSAHKLLLAPFLDWLRKTKKVSTYIWKAERQKNGQLHYHITTPSFIHYKEIRRKWNELQTDAGIIDRYRKAQQEWHRDGFKLRTGKILKTWPADAQRRAYDEGVKNNWSDPNSTDVHKVYKVKDVASYLIKEIAKSCQNSESIGGKIWDCSDNLTGVKYFDMPMKDEHQIFMDGAVDNDLATKFVDDQFVLYRFVDERVHEYLLNEKEMKDYNVWLDALREQITYVDP